MRATPLVRQGWLGYQGVRTPGQREGGGGEEGWQDLQGVVRLQRALAASLRKLEERSRSCQAAAASDGGALSKAVKHVGDAALQHAADALRKQV
jgi:hypothetical protein